MDIKALQWELAAFVVDRGLDPLHTPKNLSMALAAEAGALLDLFKWTTDDDAQGVNRPGEREAAADAIADSVLHAVHLADRLGIDVDEAIRRKLAKNAEKYPMATAPAAVAERRAEPEKRPPSPRPRPTIEPGIPSRPAPRPAPAPPPVRETLPVRETPRATRPASPPPVVEQPRAPSPPPPARAARTEAPPPPPPEPPPARAARAEPPPPPEPEPEPEPPEEEVDPYANLDPDAARRFVEALSKQVTRARSDDPLARELHDELTTLKRSLYAENPKRAWLAGSLKSIRRILEEACSHSVGAQLRAAEHLAEVERILDA